MVRRCGRGRADCNGHDQHCVLQQTRILRRKALAVVVENEALPLSGRQAERPGRSISPI
jgi:hypothetical protein